MLLDCFRVTPNPHIYLTERARQLVAWKTFDKYWRTARTKKIIIKERKIRTDKIKKHSPVAFFQRFFNALYKGKDKGI